MTANYKDALLPTYRKWHIGIQFNSQYLIHGGISFEGKILNDSFILISNPLMWTSLSVSPINQPPYLYGHACALVVPFSIRCDNKSGFYEIYDTGHGAKKIDDQIKERGLYVFGGKNKEEGMSNILYMLNLGRDMLHWKKVETYGKRPCPRYFHTMNFYERGNFIIIHGGRNDVMSDNYALDDTYILSMKTFDWAEVKLYSNYSNFTVYKRCGHSGVIYGNKLIIFGGLNANNFLGMSLMIINLDFEYKYEKSPQIDARNYYINRYYLCLKNQKSMQKYLDITTKGQLEVVTHNNLPDMK